MRRSVSSLDETLRRELKIRRLTKEFLEVSRCRRAKQRQRNVQKKCAGCAKLLFLIRSIAVFHRFPALHVFAA